MDTRLGGRTVRVLAALALFLGGSACARADVYGGGSGAKPALGPNGHIIITVDENAHGTINGFTGLQPLPAALLPDPGPGGLPSVLTYNLLNPPGLVAGDVLMRDGPGGPILDVVRFNPQQNGGSLVFYSDNVDGFDSLGDTSSPPGGLYPNNITILEIGDENNNGAIYTPLPGQPGFVTGAAAPVDYILISDGVFPAAVPEPSSLLLFGLGAGAVALWRRRRSA